MLRSIQKKIKLKPGKSMKISLAGFKWPSTFNGQFYLAAQVNATGTIVETSNTDNFAFSSKQATVSPPKAK